MKKSVILKRIIAVGMLCVCFLVPVLSIAVPVFPNTITPKSSEIQGNCCHRTNFVKTGDPTYCLSGNKRYNKALHYRRYEQLYKCPQRGCGAGFFYREAFELEPHGSQVALKLISTVRNGISKKGNDSVYHTVHFTDTKECLECGETLTIPRTATERHSKKSTVETRNGRPWRIVYSCNCGWYAYSYFN